MNLSWGSFGADHPRLSNWRHKYLSIAWIVSNSQVALPALSLTTIVVESTLFQSVPRPIHPANNATGLALNATLNWVSGSNALTHAFILG